MVPDSIQIPDGHQEYIHPMVTVARCSNGELNRPIAMESLIINPWLVGALV